MAHVIIDSCVKDMHCVECCPSDAIHPLQDEPDFGEAEQVYINPDLCADCGACVVDCPTNSIFPHLGLPKGKEKFAKVNYLYFLKEE